MGQTASQPTAPVSASASAIPAGCPMHQAAPAPPAQCPIAHDKPAAPPASSSLGPAQCPIAHDVSPLNQMPELAQTMTAGQAAALPTERVVSSIPRDAAGANWEYPSPQQFHNALARKGWETPEEQVEVMVEIHNFLNEQAWQEVLKWEARSNENMRELQLARFMGRPGEMSPKARFWSFAGWLLPSRFNTEPPFDRHDWVVRRPGTGEEVRYVIDYYSAPPLPDGSPVFSLDVRPALDSVGALKERIAVATSEAWATFKAEEAGAH